MDVCHFYKVDLEHIQEYFSEDRLHRAYLDIPLLNRETNKTICIIGQNPSKADVNVADKTLNYLERYVYEKMPAYSRIIMLNLYSRMDTRKSETTDLNRLDCERLFRKIIKHNTDFLVVFGKVKNEGSYKFIKKSELAARLLKGKNIYKIDVGTEYAPHPGNPSIKYQNYWCDIIKHQI